MLLFWKAGSGWSLCRGAVEERWLIKTGLHIQPVSSSSVGTKRRSLRMRVPKKMRQNWRKRTSSIARCFLPATRHPACRHHISLKLLPLAQLPGAGVANVSVSNLGRRPVSMVTAAAGLYEDYPAALTLEHMQWPCDLVCVCVCNFTGAVTEILAGSRTHLCARCAPLSLFCFPSLFTGAGLLHSASFSRHRCLF